MEIKDNKIDRRTFLQAGLLGAGSLLAGSAFGCKPRSLCKPAAKRNGGRPNFVFIIADQLSLDAISAHGCRYVNTPNIDRLVRSGVTFMESHSTSPVCSPARSSLMTGRMPVETGVIGNDRAINPACPTLGQWLRPQGYETVYTGKWHLPEGYTDKIDGFDVLPAGNGQGDLVDGVVSRSSQAYLANRGGDKPFLLISSLLQPHDICYWAIQNEQLVPKELPFPQIAGHLPPLPPNHTARPKAPQALANNGFTVLNDLQWQYYIYTYYRQVEMLDAEVGRILDAIEVYGHADNTIVIFTSDHGEGLGRHLNVQKWHPYDESMKVPMIVSCPSRIAAGRRDTTHLVSGLDVMGTICDYAKIKPPHTIGLSLRPLLEERPTKWRDYLVADTNFCGHIVRTDQYKYVTYPNDPVKQLFDMKTDPWEMVNLYDDPHYAPIAKEHQTLFDLWNDRLIPIASLEKKTL